MYVVFKWIIWMGMLLSVKGSGPLVVGLIRLWVQVYVKSCEIYFTFYKIEQVQYKAERFVKSDYRMYTKENTV